MQKRNKGGYSWSCRGVKGDVRKLRRSDGVQSWLCVLHLSGLVSFALLSLSVCTLLLSKRLCIVEDSNRSMNTEAVTSKESRPQHTANHGSTSAPRSMKTSVQSPLFCGVAIERF